MIPIEPSVYRNVPNYFSIIEAALFLAAWVVRDIMWSKEREKLLDRLMSKDLREFKAITNKRPIEPQAFGMMDDEALAILEERRKSEIMAGE